MAGPGPSSVSEAPAAAQGARGSGGSPPPGTVRHSGREPVRGRTTGGTPTRPRKGNDVQRLRGTVRPGRKRTRDEQNRLEPTREDVGGAGPGHGPIDLASGKDVVRPSPEHPEPEPDPEPDPDPDDRA
ncbi:DUF6191 domain-containing protein [Streptomyces sp. NPDC057433]|uniref:DUF6191 domain-containing protein n=1 Tax=Streptomyces sp. NPDC057433 TaxID=3346132 RepID=UPI0036C000DA